MATNTNINVGVRRYIASLGELRNFEPSGTQYKVVRVTYEYNGQQYSNSDVIPYDADSKYSNLEQLERDVNAGLIDPAS
jgi:hypothetical protein